MMKNYKIIKAILLFATSSSFSQLENDQDISKVGTTAAQFLKISAGARAVSYTHLTLPTT